jgi:MFS family permease
MALVVFLIGIGEAFGAPASGAIISSILPEHLLKQANVFRGAISRMGGIIGPAIGAASVALIGARLTFLVSACACFLSVISLTGVKESAHVAKEQHEPFILEIKDGIKTVREMPWVGALILMATFQLLVVVASENVLLPIITKREFHSNSVMAMATSAFAIGGVVASILSLRIKTKFPGRFTLYTWSLFAFIPLALAYQDSRALIIFAYVLGGISVGPWDAFWPSALQREVPKEKLGRVFALDHAGSLGLMPLGMALVGPVTHLMGEKNFLIFAAVFHLAVNLIVYRVPGVKEMRTPVNSSNSEQDMR